MKIVRYMWAEDYEWRETRRGKRLLHKGIHAYAYIYNTNWFERRKLNKMIAEGKTNLYKHPHSSFGADYILRVKRNM